MKKNKLGFLVFAIVLFIFSLVYKNETTPNSPSFATTYIAKADVVVSTGDNIECQINGNVSEDLAELAELELSAIPSGIRTKFVASGWHIYITDEDLAETYYKGKYSSVYGSTFYEKKLILMDDSETAIKTAMVHEFGHWFDYYLGSLSETSYFLAIHDAESERFLDEFSRGCAMNNREYFAEAFYWYIKNPAEVQEVAPRTFEFIHAKVIMMQ